MVKIIEHKNGMFTILKDGKKVNVGEEYVEIYKKLSGVNKYERFKEFNRLVKTGQIKSLSEYNQTEIAFMFGISRERVRQIEDMAIRKMKHPLVAKKIKRI